MKTRNIYCLVKSERLKLNINRKQMAEDIGISTQHLSNIESNKHVCGVDLAIIIARYFKKKVEDIFFLSQDEFLEREKAIRDILKNSDLY